jgi:transposase
MRGDYIDTGKLFTYVSPESYVPPDHPLRVIRPYVFDVLSALNADFGAIYSSHGRPSIAPERLVSALLLQVFYGIRSERQLVEQLQYNMLFRWFIGLDLDEGVFVATTFTKNRERLEKGGIFARFLTELLAHEKVKPLLSSEHFSVDGTLIEAWASHKSFQPKDGGKTDDKGDFHGEKRSNETHESVTDKEAQLYRKSAGKESKLCFMGHVLMENRHGLAVGGLVSQATGTAERAAAETLIKPLVSIENPVTLGADKGYDASEHGDNLCKMGVEPHVARHDYTTKTGKIRKTVVNAVTAASEAYGKSMTRRKAIECVFGWGKQHGTMRKTKHRGIWRVSQDFFLNITAYNLFRLPKLIKMA